MPSVKATDDCLTADEVQARAAKARKRRESGFVRSAVPQLPPRGEASALRQRIALLPRVPPMVLACYSLPPASVIGRLCGSTEPLPFTISVTLCKLTVPKLKMEDIRRAVCAETGVPLHSLLSLRRSFNLVQARHIFSMLCANLTTASFPMIGRLIRKDHTTILYGAKKLAFLFPGIQEEVGASVSAVKWVRATIAACRAFEDENGGRKAWRLVATQGASLTGARVAAPPDVLPWPFNAPPANDP